VAAGTRQRIDKWLWFARIVKTRHLAAGLVEAGHVRINRNRVSKPGHDVGVGDVLTVAVHGRVRVLKVAACAERRGAAPAARLLYDELTMPSSDGAASQKEDATDAGTC
jgi:ribosome-associated heat shock protein Hsp15